MKVFVAIWCVLIAAIGNCHAQTTYKRSDGFSGTSLHSRGSLELSMRDRQETTKEICYNSPIPSGWIKVNDIWDPTRCGNFTSISYNVYIISRYDIRPVNSQMEVCWDAPTPAGWANTGVRWDPTRCGSPKTESSNIKTITRIK